MIPVEAHHGEHEGMQSLLDQSLLQTIWRWRGNDRRSWNDEQEKPGIEH